MSNRSSEAADSFLGFYFQSMYSLIILLDASDEVTVAVETVDDVKQVGTGSPALHQLKHSLGTPAPLTEKTEGLWNAFLNWLDNPDSPNYRFVFVTCAAVAANSPIAALTINDADRSEVERNNVRDLLANEAQRIIASSVEKYSKRRREACTKFDALANADKISFLSRLTVIAANFNAGEIANKVISRLKLVPPEIRPTLAERLIEWWDRQVALSLVEQRERHISKLELLQRIWELQQELASSNLTDDFSSITPDSIAAELGGVMERQIQIVDGGPSRVERAARERWRARKQREKWLSRNLSFANELRDFDTRLIEIWGDLHGPMYDDSAARSDEENASSGRELLDWSHLDAPKNAPPFRKNVIAPSHVIRGTYQQLADELRVGWHPNYVDRLSGGGK